MSETTAPQHIGFLTLEQTKQKDGYIGAILVTDSRGVPVDFRATHPVKPSAVQKTLYGDALEPYVALELCGKQLLQAVRTKPDLLIVNRPDLLDIHRSAKCPVALLRRAGETFEVQADGRPGGSRIDSPSGRFQPLAMDLPPGAAADQDRIQQLVEAAFNHADLLEPFERIAKALEVLATQDAAFR